MQQSAALPKPKPAPKTETYSVVVKDVRVQELLFALARDAKLNVDIHPGITGTVTLNAIDQTLQQLLNRIAKQTDMRYELDGPNLVVMPDSPFLHSYKIDYVNMNRDTTGTVAVTTQIATTGTAAGGAGASGAAGNNSVTKIDNTQKNRFWDTLTQNVKDILRETDKILPEGSSETVVEQAGTQTTTGTGSQPPAGGRASGTGQPNIAGSPNPATLQNAGVTMVKRTTFREAASVIANPETGILTIRATSRQHEKIQEFLGLVMASAKRQVLIEATVAEVQLSDNYQQGIDWSRLRLNALGFKLVQKAVGAIAAPASALMEITYANPESRVGNISGTVKLLEAFGTVKVLSTPKISVMNNQTAVLKVVDNSVYFTIKTDAVASQFATQKAFTTTPQSVPVGFVMNVSPQISENDMVVLNIRPSVSRIIGTAIDPNPDLKAAGVTSEIPIIRTREMDSIIRVENGNIAVMGGLMEDTQQNTDNAVPGAWKMPLLGNLFVNRDDTRRKTELVIFLRPTVIRDPSINGDYRAFRDQIPDGNFFKDTQGPGPAPEFSSAGGRAQ